MDVEGLRITLKNHGQEHLLNFWEELSEDERKHLYNDLNSIDFAEVIKYFKQCTGDLEKAAEKVDDHLTPLPSETVGSVCRTSAEQLKEYEESGRCIISSFLSFFLFFLFSIQNCIL